MLPSLLKIKNVSPKEASVLLPIIFNRLVSMRRNIEAILEDIKSLEGSFRDLLDPDGEPNSAPFREPVGQANLLVVEPTINVDGDYVDNSRGGSNG